MISCKNYIKRYGCNQSSGGIRITDAQVDITGCPGPLIAANCADLPIGAGGGLPFMRCCHDIDTGMDSSIPDSGWYILID